MNRDNYMKNLLNLSEAALKGLVIETRAQVDTGLMTHQEAHDRINCISVALMTIQMDKSEKGVASVC